ncbi:MAG: NAD(+) diphosphatase [Phenylobacterium sp.]|nr:NAD(+) diphosphatase [Phenylobacterium sp.]
MALSRFTNTFAGNPLDRASDRRSDADWIAAQRAHADAMTVALWKGEALVEAGKEGERLAYLNLAMAEDAAGHEGLFLGLWKDAPIFAIDFAGSADPCAGPLSGLGRFQEMRGAGMILPGPEAGLAATAKSLFDWHEYHPFCSKCGHASEVVDGGWKRLCPSCRTEHFPRVNPVTIMLPVFEDRCLLGRQAAWPTGRMSALAGFLEPGESIEEACARELMEEAGLTATRVAYHSSQPWPFPSNLMIGLIAEVSDDDARPDQTELESVRWFTRDEMRKVLTNEKGWDGVLPPPPLAIARTLLDAWVDGFEG